MDGHMMNGTMTDGMNMGGMDGMNMMGMNGMMMDTMNCSMQLSAMGGMMSMRMTFYFGHCLRLLFDSWVIDTAGKLVGSMVAVFFMAVFYEGLKTLRDYLIYLDMKNKKMMEKKRAKLSPEDSKNMEAIGKRPEQCCSRKDQMRYYSISIGAHIIQSLLHVVQVGMGYILMLVAMTYNAWLFLAVAFGAGTGYLLFAKTRYLVSDQRDRNECCQ